MPRHFLEGEKLMNKSEFVAAVATKTEWSKAQAGDAVQAFLDCVADALKEQLKPETSLTV